MKTTCSILHIWVCSMHVCAYVFMCLGDQPRALQMQRQATIRVCSKSWGLRGLGFGATLDGAHGSSTGMVLSHGLETSLVPCSHQPIHSAINPIHLAIILSSQPPLIIHPSSFYHHTQPSEAEAQLWGLSYWGFVPWPVGRAVLGHIHVHSPGACC